MTWRLAILIPISLLPATSPAEARASHDATHPSAAPTPLPGLTAKPTSVVEPPFAPHPNPADDRCYYERSHDSSDLCAYWRSAVAAESAAKSAAKANDLASHANDIARWGLLFSIAGIVGLIATLRVTIEANSDNRRIGKAQVRCYLSIEAVRAYISEADGLPHLHVAIHNSGASPALEANWKAQLSYKRKDGAERSSGRSYGADSVRVAVPPSGTFDVPAVAIDFPVVAAERAALVTAGAFLQLIVRITVTAKDVFGDRVETEDLFAGSIHDVGVWFALDPIGADPIRSVKPIEGTERGVTVIGRLRRYVTERLASRPAA